MRTYDEWLQNQGQTEFRPIELSDMPKDHDRSGHGWRFKVLEHGGREPDTMPQWIEATDSEGRSAIYEAIEPTDPDDRPQDFKGTGTDWTFETRDHDANGVPHSLIGRDSSGREAVYAPLRNEGVIGKWELVSPTG